MMTFRGPCIGPLDFVEISLISGITWFPVDGTEVDESIDCPIPIMNERFTFDGEFFLRAEVRDISVEEAARENASYLKAKLKRCLEEAGVLSFTEFCETYRPVHHSDDAYLGGRLFAPYGEQLSEVMDHEVRHVWTVLQDEEEDYYITRGRRRGGDELVGYLVTEIAWPDYPGAYISKLHHSEKEHSYADIKPSEPHRSPGCSALR